MGTLGFWERKGTSSSSAEPGRLTPSNRRSMYGTFSTPRAHSGGEEHPPRVSIHPQSLRTLLCDPPLHNSSACPKCRITWDLLLMVWDRLHRYFRACSDWVRVGGDGRVARRRPHAGYALHRRCTSFTSLHPSGGRTTNTRIAI